MLAALQRRRWVCQVALLFQVLAKPTPIHPAEPAHGYYHRLQQLEKEYETLKENDPAELQKAVSLTQVGRRMRTIDAARQQLAI